MVVFVSFQCLNEHWPFVVGIEGKILDAGKAQFINAQMKLGSKLCRFADLTAYYRANIWLTDTDDPVRNLVGVVFEHVLLLLVDLPDRFKVILVFAIQIVSLPNEVVNVFHISVDISELLSDCLSDSVNGRLLGLCKRQIFLVGNLSIRAWFLQSILEAEPVNHFFELRPGFVEQRSVLRKPDVLRSYCCVTDLCCNKCSPTAQPKTFLVSSAFRHCVTECVVCFDYEGNIDPLSPFHKQGRGKRRRMLE